MYFEEKFLEHTQRERNKQIEQGRLVAQAREKGKRHNTHGLIWRCGALLVELGTRLEQVEQRQIHSQA